jgi:hypothetical protein
LYSKYGIPTVGQYHETDDAVVSSWSHSVRNPSTRAQYLSEVRTFAKSLSRQKVISASVYQVRAYVKDAGVSVFHRRRRLSALRSFYGFIRKRSLRKTNPTDGLSVPRPRYVESVARHKRALRKIGWSQRVISRLTWGEATRIAIETEDPPTREILLALLLRVAPASRQLRAIVARANEHIF